MTSSPLAKPVQSSIAHTLLAETVAYNRNPTIEDFNFSEGLPTADDLPCSDGKPVDSILQELLPELLKTILIYLWKERTDWLFGMQRLLELGVDPDS